jgi:hypothetical protein
MSEKSKQPSLEKPPERVEHIATQEQKDKAPEEKTAEAAIEHDHNLDKIQASIHEKAISGKDITIERHQTDTQPVLGLQRELKSAAYQKTLLKVQTKLNPAERSLSKVIHQPFIESASDIGSKSVARPSGILGGGVVALIGSGLLLYMAKHYGFEYNYFVFIALFLAGFFVGLGIELLVKAVRRK